MMFLMHIMEELICPRFKSLVLIGQKLEVKSVLTVTALKAHAQENKPLGAVLNIDIFLNQGQEKYLR